ncbi:MAG: molybdopterin-binding protein [Peptoniphilaceae bacterium]|nr:molybdopterin-binding protein [Peptoniphilaceae bacterium]
MIKKVKIEDAIGQPLLHDLTGIMADGFKGVVFKRNHIVQEEDLEKLRDIGKDHIYVGELDKDCVHEEDAISEVAPLLIGDNISLSKPSEGKISFTSKVFGLFTINRQALLELNQRGIYTFATIKSYSTVKKGDKLVGARIVPLYTDRKEVEIIKEIGKKYGPIFEVREFKKLKVGVIITGSEIYYGRIKDLFEPIIRKKIAFFDGKIQGIKKCPDDLEMIEEISQEFLDEGCDLIVFSGGMSVDPDDLTPRVIRSMSDKFIIQGLPMQPGNMLTVGKNKQTYLVGVPGASIHSEITSFDFFLPRIFAGIDLKKSDFTEMGEGGLL